jgi:hypothetical protein
MYDNYGIDDFSFHIHSYMHTCIYTYIQKRNRTQGLTRRYRERRKERDEKEMVAEAHSVFISVMGQRKM